MPTEPKIYNVCVTSAQVMLIFVDCISTVIKNIMMDATG